MRLNKDLEELFEVAGELHKVFTDKTLDQLLPIAIQIQRNKILEAGLKNIEDKIDILKSTLG